MPSRVEIAGSRVSTIPAVSPQPSASLRQAEAFRMNDSGWTEQLVNIERNVNAS
jgi:hypothetical protein